MGNTPKSKRKAQIEESKKAKRYLKAKFNEKIGYWFIALWYFAKNNIRHHKKKISYLIIGVSILLIIISIFNFIKASQIQAEIDDYNKKNIKLEHKITDKQEAIKKQENQIDEYNISASPKIVNASKILSNVFHGMYDYTDADIYQKNRDKNLKYFQDPKSKDVKSIYNEDEDSSGESIIDNLDLNSTLLEYNFFTEYVKHNNGNTLNLKAIVKYESEMTGVSSNYSTRTHETVYDIEFDTKKEKIIKIKKDNTLKEDKSIE